MTDAPNPNAVATTDQQEPRTPKAPLTAGNAPRAIVPVDFEGAYRIANVVTAAGMAPKTLNTVEKAMVAILHGLEVGLTPMNALQSIAVINGRPTIWGDGAIGLIRASGKLEYMKEYYENEDTQQMKAICIVKRKGEAEPVKSDFSMNDARVAGLLGKEGPWQTYPKRMLKMRARWPLRDVFADVLKGLSLREEVEDMDVVSTSAEPAPATTKRVVPSATPAIEDKTQETGTATTATAQPEKPKRVRPSRAKPKTDQAAAPDTTEPPEETQPVEVAQEKPKPVFSDDERDWLSGLGGAFSGCEDRESLDTEGERLMDPWQGKVTDEAWQAAVDLYQEHVERLTLEAEQ